MPRRKYKVTLEEDDENLLHDIINQGKHGAQNGSESRLCSLSVKDNTDEMTAGMVGMHCRAIEALRQRFVEDGVLGKP
jgi:hypothetical protein